MARLLGVFASRITIALRRLGAATVVSREEELEETDVRTESGLFEVSTIGDAYCAFIIECEDPKSCTILLRGSNGQKRDGW